jgi:hypothetical protein
MAETMRFRAWYEDRRVYSSAEVSFQSLPAEGMVGVVVYLSESVTPFRQIVDGGDWYYLRDGRIHAAGTVWGGYVERPDVGCAACVKRSGVLDDRTWAAVQREMMAAREAP